MARIIRYPLLAGAILVLLTSAWAGLVRLGWPWPVFRNELPIDHGPLMVSGFLGTLIGLERAVALGKRWAYLGPLATGLGAVLLLAGFGGMAGAVLITLGSLGLVLVFLPNLRRHTDTYIWTMAMGALCWLVGNLLWLSGWQIYELVLWWAGFLILTIAGERLELGRIAHLSRGSQWAFLLVAAIFSLFLGFVFSLIFGHAPLIFPAILGVQIRFSPSFYVPLVLLHGSLIGRVIGDLAGLPGWRQWGGLWNAVALLLFVGNVGFMVYRGRRIKYEG